MSASEEISGNDANASIDITEAAPAPRRGGRLGGRQARWEMRAAPLTEDIKPVRPGMPGGTYKPLSDGDVEKVHEAVLDVLENIGLSQATPTCQAVCEKVGAIMCEDGRLRFPRQLGWTRSKMPIGVLPFMGAIRNMISTLRIIRSISAQRALQSRWLTWRKMNIAKAI